MGIIQAIFRVARDLAANWSSENPILKVGEPGHETDTGYTKYGDGAQAWNDLDYAGAPWPAIGGVPDSLLSIGALTPEANTFPYFKLGGGAELADLTPFARTLLEDIDATAARTTLGAQQSDPDLDAVAASGVAAAWASYTPSISNATSPNAAGRYLKIGRLVIFSVRVPIATSAAPSYLVVGLPFTPVIDTVLFGRETASTGHSVSGTAFAGVSSMVVAKYDGSNPNAAGATIVISGSYEASS